MSDSPKTDQSDSSREADYIDYEGRDVRDGWPYSDEDSAAGRRNGHPNGSVRDLAEDDDAGMQVSGEPTIDSSGGPQLDGEDEHQNIADDDLEEHIFNILTGNENIDVSGATVTVHSGVATLTGSVETQEARALANRLVRSVAGIRDTVNELSTTGADSHIPDDYDE